ncbi:hypothetical protein BDK51DRAFT_51193 [Blyttiomyces helicus]|uniref:Uncharacterized protein n=1 Tax=Blyttiomyces helicus TaxID=388810 RepID=A0A4P9W3H1_9FUNG|nr:hypothetical protein BDK51DRAFT_51193 [Blyttiomyces helicus]|eukprot:RKO86362.1 hypothetical protein BDK51DRAFT_51193 [Blyttiomyces helicus]
MKLLAVPLFELYDNSARYGPQLSALPHLLSSYEDADAGPLSATPGEGQHLGSNLQQRSTNHFHLAADGGFRVYGRTPEHPLRLQSAGSDLVQLPIARLTSLRYEFDRSQGMKRAAATSRNPVDEERERRPRKSATRATSREELAWERLPVDAFDLEPRRGVLALYKWGPHPGLFAAT